MQPTHFFIYLLLFTTAAFPAIADTASDMTEMQKRLNQEILEKPFHVEDASKIDSYIADAMKRNLQPKQNPPSDWRPGLTCDSYYRHRYNYHGYRDCLYYRRYYGRYW